MEKIILYQIQNSSEIERLAANMKIRVIHADASLYDETLDAIVSGQAAKMPAASGTNEPRELPAGSILIFCDLSEKHLNRMLFEIRSHKIPVDLKAILTPSNRKWTLRQLHRELERERLSFTR